MREHFARMTAWWAFRSARSSARRYRDFCCAERNSELEILAAARLTPSAERCALYLRHAIDEGRHAELFFQRANTLHEATAPAFPDVDVDDLFARLGERDFLAFVHHGERRGAAQFRGYVRHFRAKAGAAADPAKLFAGILVDEDRHESTSWRLLVELCDGNEGLARRRLRRIGVVEAARQWHRNGRSIAGAVYVLAMLLLFVLSAPLAVWLKRTRPTPTGWA